MRSFFNVSAGAVLLLAALIFFCGWQELAALLLAAGVHELGHLLALRALGCRVTGLRLELTGACMERLGGVTALGEVIAAAAGPAAGLLAAFILSAADTGPALRASGVSLALSLFNLLPVPRLDGGRILAALAGERVAEVCGGIVCLVLLGVGLWLIASGAGAWLFVAALWLTLWQADL